jgi:hypothetical protein
VLLQEHLSWLSVSVSVPAVAPHLTAPFPEDVMRSHGDPPLLGTRKIRIGFVSKFFVEEHPTAELLKVHHVVVTANRRDCPRFISQGVVQGLSGSYFHKVVLSIPHGTREVDSDIVSASDEFVVVPPLLEQALPTISRMSLDILVFSDVLSEAIS